MFNFSKLIITLFGIGFFPFASGTVASFFTLLFFYCILDYLSILTLIISFLSIFFISIVLINLYSSITKTYDSSEIVIDEFLGIMIILLFYDYINFANDQIMFCLIFIIFRFFDVIKIYPANWIDKNIKNGFGVITDDLVAGLYSVFILFILNAFI